MNSKYTKFSINDLNRENNLDFLRFIFATLVIFSHSYPLRYGEEIGNAIEPFSVLTNGQITGGKIAVAYFFIISGFLITQSWLKNKRLDNYIIRRFLRIYPGFIAMSIFCLVIVSPIATGDRNQWLAEINPFQFIVHQALLYFPGNQYVFATNPIPGAINGSAWTIRYEFWCYIFLAALGIIGLLKQRLLMLGLFVFWLFMLAGWSATGGVSIELFENNYAKMIFGELNHHIEFIGFFLAGSMFFLYRDKILFSAKLFILSILVLIALSALGIGLIFGLMTFGAYVVFYLGFFPTKRLSRFASKGDFSYGIYLYAFPIQQLIVLFLGTSLSPLSISLLALPPTLALAFLSWHIVELPCLKLKDRLQQLTSFTPNNSAAHKQSICDKELQG
ncbi:acyltransferase [Candidatus Chloroploca sp. M-50]|uniref:Acyltransferase n=1 Tax=Candidatus Chloroploca mongolica TaxID=2528176 RepID=A0ABS4D625_9CHLR|nr:acyltransferase [Candidatus Chloroploca mongolica]MBP1464878.1 acyltransferase [Candidatus Chloroploca mongolica]